MFSETAGLEDLVNKKIKRIAMSNEYLAFGTDQGDYAFSVEGDCCSYSYFYDFYGVRHLLDNGPVTGVEFVPLDEVESAREYSDYVRGYGFRLFTEHPVWKEVTSVFSFRNDSNGYYGGWMYEATPLPETLTNLFNQYTITDDITLDEI